MITITDRQTDALRALAGLDQPSVWDLAAALGVSYGAAQHHLHMLESAGLIARKQGVPRSVRLTRRGKDYLRKGKP